MFFWNGGSYEPIGGPFCVHVAAISAPVAAAQLVVPGAAEPTEDDEPAAGVLVVGQVFCPGVSTTVDATPAGGTHAPGPVVGEAFKPGFTEAQAACEDD